MPNKTVNTKNIYGNYVDCITTSLETQEHADSGGEEEIKMVVKKIEQRKSMSTIGECKLYCTIKLILKPIQK